MLSDEMRGSLGDSAGLGTSPSVPFVDSFVDEVDPGSVMRSARDLAAPPTGRGGGK